MIPVRAPSDAHEVIISLPEPLSIFSRGITPARTRMPTPAVPSIHLMHPSNASPPPRPGAADQVRQASPTSRARSVAPTGPPEIRRARGRRRRASMFGYRAHNYGWMISWQVRARGWRARRTREPLPRAERGASAGQGSAKKLGTHVLHVARQIQALSRALSFPIHACTSKSTAIILQAFQPVFKVVHERPDVAYGRLGDAGPEPSAYLAEPRNIVGRAHCLDDVLALVLCDPRVAPQANICHQGNAERCGHGPGPALSGRARPCTLPPWLSWFRRMETDRGICRSWSTVGGGTRSWGPGAAGRPWTCQRPAARMPSKTFALTGSEANGLFFRTSRAPGTALRISAHVPEHLWGLLGERIERTECYVSVGVGRERRTQNSGHGV